MGGNGLNRSGYNSKMLRGESPAAPAGHPEPFGHVNDYWVQRRKQREAASIKRQATSKKWKLNKFTMDEDVYIEIKD